MLTCLCEKKGQQITKVRWVHPLGIVSVMAIHAKVEIFQSGQM